MSDKKFVSTEPKENRPVDSAGNSAKNTGRPEPEHRPATADHDADKGDPKEPSISGPVDRSK